MGRGRRACPPAAIRCRAGRSAPAGRATSPCGGPSRLGPARSGGEPRSVLDWARRADVVVAGSDGCRRATTTRPGRDAGGCREPAAAFPLVLVHLTDSQAACAWSAVPSGRDSPGGLADDPLRPPFVTSTLVLACSGVAVRRTYTSYVAGRASKHMAPSQSTCWPDLARRAARTGWTGPPGDRTGAAGMVRTASQAASGYPGGAAQRLASIGGPARKHATRGYRRVRPRARPVQPCARGASHRQPLS